MDMCYTRINYYYIILYILYIHIHIGCVMSEKIGRYIKIMSWQEQWIYIDCLERKDRYIDCLERQDRYIDCLERQDRYIVCVLSG